MTDLLALSDQIAAVGMRVQHVHINPAAYAELRHYYRRLKRKYRRMQRARRKARRGWA